MSDPETKERINQILADDYPSVNGQRAISERCQIAIGLLAEESAEVQAQWTARAKEEHEAAVAEHASALRGLPSAEPEHRAE